MHIAIVTPPYDRLILEGRKTIECRLTKARVPPFGCIAPGERIYFKRSSGPFFAIAVADRVWMSDSLTPQEVERLRETHNDEIHGTMDYFARHRGAKYATLVWLREVAASSERPPYKPQHMRAWLTLAAE